MRLRTQSTRRVGAQQAHQRVGEQPGPARVLVAPVDHLDRRPPGPVPGAVGGEQVAPRQRLEGGARAGEHAGHPGPARPLDGDVAGVPGRRLLLLVGLVVLVEHARRRPGRPTGAHAAARVPTTVAPAAPSAQSPGCGGHRHARRGAAASLIVAAIAAVGHSTRALPQRRGRDGDVHEVRGRRQAQHRPRRRRRRSASSSWSGGADGAVGRGRGRLGDDPLRATRSGGTTPGDPPSATPPTRPGRSAPAAGPSPLRLASGRSATPAGGSTSDRDDPAARPGGRAARCAPRPRRAPGPGRRPGPGSRRSCRSPARPAAPGRRAASRQAASSPITGPGRTSGRRPGWCAPR